LTGILEIIVQRREHHFFDSAIGKQAASRNKVKWQAFS
jgi:hypothetical protein